MQVHARSQAFVIKPKDACRDHHEMGLRRLAFIGSVQAAGRAANLRICDKNAHNGAIK